MRRFAGWLALVVVAIAGRARPLPAQTQDAEVMKVVNRLFDAMRARDTVGLRSVFDTTARLISTSSENGAPVIQSLPIGRFVTVIGGAKDALNERIWDAEVRVDDNVATVWTKYDFLRNGQFSHCGVDALQLVRTSAGWKIVHLVDTQRRGEGCWRAPAKQ